MRHLLVLFETQEIKEILPYKAEAKAVAEQKGKFGCRVSKSIYIETVNKLLTHIKRGDIYEINYCIEFFAKEVVIDPQAVFLKLKALTEAPFTQLLKSGDNWIMGASPERFLKNEGNKLLTQPMKGTAKRGQSQGVEEVVKKHLAQSKKEQTENVMAVDVARNDLSHVAKKGTVVTDELFGVQTFKNVHQMVSTVSCELKDKISFSDIIEATFPPASMTGAPKIKALELIKKYELSPRGIYSGAIGVILDNGDFDLWVVIRTIIYNEKQKTLSFHVGSAITAGCNPEEEWNECLLKADSLLKALDVKIAEVEFAK